MILEEVHKKYVGTKVRFYILRKKFNKIRKTLHFNYAMIFV